jgi:hypothetical protein
MSINIYSSICLLTSLQVKDADQVAGVEMCQAMMTSGQGRSIRRKKASSVGSNDVISDKENMPVVS